MTIYKAISEKTNLDQMSTYDVGKLDTTRENKDLLLFVLKELGYLTDPKNIKDIDTRQLTYTCKDLGTLPLVPLLSILKDTPKFDYHAYLEYWNEHHYIPEIEPNPDDPACAYAMQQHKNDDDDYSSICDHCPLIDSDNSDYGICTRPGANEYNELLELKHKIVRYGSQMPTDLEEKLDGALTRIRNAPVKPGIFVK